MDTERLLISKVIETGQIAPAARAGVGPKWFTDPASAQVWKMLTEHVSRYGNVPTIGVVKADYPTYKLLATPETLDYLVDRMVRHRSLSLLEMALTDAASAHVRGDLEGVTARLHGVLADVARATMTSADINLTKNGADRLARYRELAELDGRLRGIPSGFSAIDAALQGFEGGQLITFVGPPKAGKSTALLLMAKAAQESGKTPLFVGFEMSNWEQSDRLDAARAGISHARLRNGTLKPADWKRLERSIAQMESMPDFHMTADAQSVLTLTGLRAKIEAIGPDIVFVDGVYMMQDENGEPSGSPQALTNITRGLKRMAQQLGIPIVIATQALESKMAGKKLSTFSIGYSSSFVQDSDAVIGVENTEDPEIKKMRLLTARNASPMEVFYQWCWDPVSFEELEGDPFGSAGGDWDE
ncbi:DnaB-like helicase C-terminal domain-containing protein [Microbispora sp. NPDC049633]|uniref:DnaB-like helicase C-terminal domain-containing protein n=1 Tax=Microbispora sp. NPDC049633 TaxID=3154355 RepID=UPI0034129467